MAGVQRFTLHGLLAVVMMHSAESYRRTKTEETSSTSSNAEHPAELSCFLGSGFALDVGCQASPPIEPPPKCSLAVLDGCYVESTIEKVRVYSRDIRTSSDYSSLTNSITEAEGGGFGASISASFTYLKRSQVSEKSTAFFIGASGISKKLSIRNPQKLKLTPIAKHLLQQDPPLFLQFYGPTYVHTITEGGSFLGSVTLSSTQSSDEQDLKAFADFSVNQDLFSGNTNFENTLKEKRENISIFMSADWRGGTVPIAYGSAEKLGAMFESWEQTWRQNTTRMTVATRSWFDLEDVQEIVVKNMTVEHQLLFLQLHVISPTTQTKISLENAKIMKIEHSVEQALTQANSTTRECLNEVKADIGVKRLQIDLLNQTGVLKIQAQYLSGDDSWFESDSLNSRYKMCVA